jgi:uncharacterized protein (DUF1778 family)
VGLAIEAAVPIAIEQMKIIRLSAEDSRTFAAALLNQRQPDDKLKAAARRFMQMSRR